MSRRGLFRCAWKELSSGGFTHLLTSTMRILSFPWREMIWPLPDKQFAGVSLFAASIMLADHYIRVNEAKVSDIITNFLHRILPLSWQHKIRDSGFISFIVDVGAYFRAIEIALRDLQCALDFRTATADLQRFQYGDTADHILEVFEPYNSSVYDRKLLLDRDTQSPVHAATEAKRTTRTLVFVHGGAWGCGRPWHYRTVANGLGVLLGVNKVVVVGYPTYPLSTILMQGELVADAVRYIQNNETVRQLVTGEDRNTAWDATKHSIVLCGHSSGANICAHALLNDLDINPVSDGKRPRTALNVDTFIGLAGVYDIGKHYLFESNRGVQVISPMCAAACGRKCFGLCSPTTIVRGLLRRLAHSPTTVSASSDKTGDTNNPAPSAATTTTTSATTSATASASMAVTFPRTVLIHGRGDAVVPLSSSEEFAAALKDLGGDVDVYPVKLDHMQPLDDCTKGCHTPHSEVARALRSALVL